MTLSSFTLEYHKGSLQLNGIVTTPTYSSLGHWEQALCITNSLKLASNSLNPQLKIEWAIIRD